MMRKGWRGFAWPGMLFGMRLASHDQYDRFASIEYRDEPYGYQQAVADAMRRRAIHA
jgi:hypothetical protein